MSLTCRVQYLNDIDPFSYTTNFPDPPRPPLHTFSVTLPLINQLAAIHRLLKSPHRCDSIFSAIKFVYLVPNFKPVKLHWMLVLRVLLLTASL
ncbi:hypothetical protein NQ317_016172 [Molorchus minor]|uniref:FHOD1 N-terminal GTPase-binding domain-containing protein n=1 Tax=Molorchus minor TaxID=1323400 RepID=A0ABQ9JRV9_9CUCU|nr:hypothetical protein NQ317_016172 [Molorchus minor]